MIAPNSMRHVTPSQPARPRFLSIIALMILTTLAVLLMISPLDGGWRRFSANFAYGFAYANGVGWLGWLIMPRVGMYSARFKLIPRWAMVIGSMIAIAVAGSFIALALLATLGFFPWSRYWARFWGGLQLTMAITMVTGVAFFLYESMRYRLQYEAARARLSSLESRIQPHFLFNTLNSISALIPEDPTAAERMTEKFAALLRFSLDSTDRATVPLEHELKIATDYLEIEKTRFGSRLNYSIDVPPELMCAEVPPFSLQTLVENSVKYGGGDIRVSARNGNGRLILTVWDSGADFAKDMAMPAGHGLHNLRSRLAALWGSSATLEFHREHAGNSARISLPAAGK